MIIEMSRKAGLTLREKATLAWRHERPMREAARLERRAKQLAAVREKLRVIFGTEYEIKVGIDAEEKVIATVEDLRFTAITYSYELINLSLVERCPRCGEDLPIAPISNLADVGEALEAFESGLRHECN
jgi:hypothetical protein